MCFCSPVCFGLCWNDCAFILERACMIDYNIWRFLYVYFGHRSSCRTSNCSVPVSSAWTPLCIELLTQSVLIMWYMNQTKPPKFYQKINDIFHLNVCRNVRARTHSHTRVHTGFSFFYRITKTFNIFGHLHYFDRCCCWSKFYARVKLSICHISRNMLLKEVSIMKRLFCIYFPPFLTNLN